MMRFDCNNLIISFLLFALLAFAGVVGAQDDINLDLGTIPAGQQVTITFDVVIAADLPPGVTQISNQGLVAGDNFGPLLTDDPDTSAFGDATITQLAILQINPFLRKQADPPFALPGEQVTFSFTVANPNPFEVANVVAIDAIPASLELLSASSSSGSVSVAGQTVSFQQSAMAADETATITVNTRIRDDVEPPFILVNEVCGMYDGSLEVCAQASVTSVAELPRTGETPWWRAPLLVALSGLAGLAVAGGASLLVGRLRAMRWRD